MSPLLDMDGVVIWALAAAVAVAIVLPYAWSFRRRRLADRARLAEARALGIDRPTAQFPFIDPAHCIGCGACVRACPEGDVLGVVGGIAVVINGLRCVGHGRCADACPVGAIEIGLGDLKGRRDVPLLTAENETSIPGVFVAGELGGLALIRNAVEQGSAVARTVARRVAAAPSAGGEEIADLLVVGAGPAGIAAALAAREAGLRVEIVDQGESLGGTLLHFPRRKLVLTRPVEFPGGTALAREEYSKEELLELLQSEVRSRRLEVAYGEKLESIERPGGALAVRTSRALRRARHVVLALGRRGTPRKLGVPGEELSKVMYQLRDAESYRGQRILVVGGGDSAIEAAVGLVRQPGTKVTLSYRKNAFYRIKRKNQSAIEVLMERNRVRVLFDSAVESIDRERATLRVGERSETIDNDYVFVFAGGEPPFELLRRVGVRFGGDAEAAPPPARRPGALLATFAGLLLALGAAAGARAQESPHGEKIVACTDCHDPDRWLPVKPSNFRHESTGFALAGRHAKLDCTKCHTSLVFSRTPTACADCHRDVHRGALGLACERCHDPASWDVRDEFGKNGHQRSLFPLLAGHARVDCASCHEGQRADQYVFTPTDCAVCHKADYLAAGTPAHSGPPVDCLRCHSPFPQNWAPTNFEHPARFPLTGEHARLACSDCHKGPAGTTSPECYACHAGDYAGAKDPNHVAGGFPTQCANCHTTSSWTGGTFDHATTGFPLDGAHRTTACSACHTNGYAGTPSDCYSCHKNDYNATTDPNHKASGLPTTCQNCHSTTSWASASFDHATTGFPLDGAHRTTACSACHTNGYAGTPTDCYACHKKDYDATTDPNHKTSGFPTNCRNCHSTTSWASASFDHATTGFALQGAHTKLTCTSCHAGGYAGTPSDCYACHKADYNGASDPPHASGGFPTACLSCHTQSAWSPATFDHSKTAFPLQGAHTKLACSACHSKGYAGTPTDCYSCHQSDYQGAENHVSQNYPKQCQQCHNQNTWGD